MLAIKIEIIKFIDDHQPGFVEARFYDVWNHEYKFQDKVSIFTNENINKNSLYPKTGIIACLKINDFLDNTGRKIITVNTENPWGLESIDGFRQFEILENQLTEI